MGMKKRDCTVSVAQIGGLVSELANLIQSKRVTLQDPAFRPDPLHDDWFRAPIVEFTQRHSLKRTSLSRERLDAAHETPRGDLSGAPGVQKDGVGTNHPEGSLQQTGKKHKKDYNFRPKGCLNSNDRTSYQRGGGGDAQGSTGQVRLTPNENAARPEVGYSARRDGGSNPQTDNRYKGNPRDADPEITWVCGKCKWINFDFQLFCLRNTCGLRKGEATRARVANKKRRTF